MRSFLSMRNAHGDLCKHLGIDSSTDHPDRYSNLFLNAYMLLCSSHVEEIKNIIISILARPDDTSSRSLAFRPLHHG